MATLEHPAPAPVTDHAATSTGLPHLKLAMWLFLASDCLLFGALISTYVLYRGASVVGPFPADLSADLSAKLRHVAAVFRATTGRPRRGGRFDAQAYRRGGSWSSQNAELTVRRRRKGCNSP